MVPRMAILLLIVALPSAILAQEDSDESTSASVSGELKKAAQSTKSALKVTASSIKQATSNVENKIKDVTSDAAKKAGNIESKIGSVIAPSDSHALEKAVNDPDPTTAPPATTISENDIDDGLNTKGIIVVAESFMHPVNQLFYQFLDALLRNAENRALPCIVTSWMPLRGKCSRIA